ncbi:MAG: amidohydrolase family protein [Candidatus Bathyarchaeota archaeon]|nr:amidohydrolase family protein [Candidatus Bathyarchaeota archaeon]
MTQFDLILKKGHVIDPANGVDAILDVAIAKRRVAAVEPDINPRQAKSLIDLSGKVVVPGIIDPHVHIRNVGHRNMAKVGVVTAVDVSAHMNDVLQGTKAFGTGMNIADITSIHHQIKKPHPSRAELNAMLDDYLTSGALGVKVIQEPLPQETILNAISAANEKAAYVKLDCGVTEEGSNLLGLKWIVEAAGSDLHLDIAHINSYCRGQVKEPVEEALDAIRLIEGKKNIQSESYFGIINGTNGRIVDGVPLNECTRDCLRLGGYPETEEGMKRALLDGYCKVPELVGGETLLLEGAEALKAWLETDQRTVCFPVNIPSVAILLATRKDAKKRFVVNAISTDGGSTPRNLIVNSGLALVRYGALTLSEFVVKTSFNPSRMYGMLDKGGLGVGMDADVTVLDLEKGRAVMGIALGTVIMVDGVVVGRGGTIITTEKGVKHVKATGLPYDVVDLNKCGLYA